MDTYTIGDWVTAGWSLTELAEKAKSERWTAQRVIEWCIDHADDAAQEAEVRAMPGYDELVAILEDMIEAGDRGTATVGDLVVLRKGLAAAGYCDRLAIRRLLTDLRGRLGCERIQERSLNNYLAGRSRMPPAVEKGLAALIERGAEQ